jgi:NIPSNAP
MLYDVMTITVQPGSASQALAKLERAFARQLLRGELLTCWLSEIGALNRILLIRGYADINALETDRRTITSEADPFELGELVTAADLDLYVPFEFVDPMRPGSKAAFYEVRTYGLKPDALTPTKEAWRQALPERVKLSRLLMAMHTTGPTPRFMHIWPYESLADRQRIRAEAVARGLWPPRGGPGRLSSQQTDIYIPAAFSPIG